MLTRDRLAQLAPFHFKLAYSPRTVELFYFTKDVVNRRYAEWLDADADFGSDLYRYFRLAEIAQGDSRNLYIPFEPWLIPESAELASVFVRDLARAIGDKLGDEVAMALDRYRLSGPAMTSLAHRRLPEGRGKMNVRHGISP